MRGVTLEAALSALFFVCIGCSSPPTAPLLWDPFDDEGATVDAASSCRGRARQPPASSCRCDLDCEPGAYCASEAEVGTPGGFCLRACDPAAPPREGLRCETHNDRSFFVEGCGSGGASSCRSGWLCRVYTLSLTDRAQDRYTCEPHCTSDAQCLTGSCDRYTGLCRPAAPGRANHAPCTLSAQCRSGLCIAVGEGSCASTCDTRDGFCPDGGYCLPPAQSASGAQNGTCLARCATAADCRSGFECTPYMGQGVCMPRFE